MTTKDKLPNLSILIFLSALSALPTIMLLPSLPHIAAALRADYAVANLAITGYALMNAIAQVVSGVLSDRYGRRPVALGALAIFFVASVGCSFAQDIATFLAFRTLQGVVSACFAVSMASIRDASSDEDTTSRIAFVSSAWAVAPLLGPIIGGALDDLFGWRAIFIAFSGLGLAGLLLAYNGFGETRMRDRGATFRLANYLSPMAWPVFWGYAACMVFSQGTLFIFLSAAPLVAKSFGIGSGILVGALMAISPAAFICGSAFAGRFGKQCAPPVLMASGRILTLGGLATGLLLFYFGSDHVLAFFLPCASVGLGNGLTMPAANAGVLSLRSELSGTALGLAGATTVAGSAAIVAISGVFLTTANAHWSALALMSVATAISLVAVSSLALASVSKPIS
ncbi:UNVERIFIED_ORG: putative MFS family arabinose efflux permease [Martelella mediterranea]